MERWDNMYHPKLIAVGSDISIAREIRGIIRSIIGANFPVDTMLINEISSPQDGCLYVCSSMKQLRLANIIPSHQLIPFDLRPTTKFFLDVSHVPIGETITIFTSLRAYIDLLQRECYDMGLHGLRFRGIAFSEMSTADIMNALEKSHYVFAMAPFASDAVLYSPHYLAHLPKDAIITKIKRTTSIASASRLLLRLTDEYYHKLYDEYNQFDNFSDSDVSCSPAEKEALLQLVHKCNRIVHGIQQSAMEAVKQQIGLSAMKHQPPAEPQSLKSASPSDLQQQARTQLLTICYLRDEVGKMTRR